MRLAACCNACFNSRMGRRHRTEKTETPRTQVPPREAGGAWIPVVAVLLCAACYANSVPGDFIYDDAKQIVDNRLVKENRFFWEAMTSDVWAFHGKKAEAWSNYWRPAFVLWLIINDRLFGMSSPVPWHITNILLHAGVTLLAYAVLRRLRVERLVAAAITFLFAVHPVHVESVAWISGCTDMLLAIPLLGALWLVLSAWERPSAGKWFAAMACYLAAQSAKEAAFLFAGIVLVAGLSLGQGWRKTLLSTLPFVALAAGFFMARHAVLKMTQLQTPWAPGPVGTALTAPSLLAFYLRQSLFPWYSIGPSYPLRAVKPDTIGLENALVPIIVVLLGFGFLLWLAWRHPVRRIGLSVFALLLLPAMNIDAFIQEQLVHDRYLYLPILGLLMVVVPAAAAGLSRVFKDAGRAARTCLIGSGVACVPLGALTVWYNTAWTSELNLWAWGVKSDPGSAFNLSQYGLNLIHSGRVEEGKPYLDAAIKIYPVTTAILMRADLATKERRYADAERDYRLILSQFPTYDQAYKRLAVCYLESGRASDAETTLRTAREKCGYMYCAFTDSLAIVLYQMNRKSDALAELEAVRGRIKDEFSGEAAMALYHLGSLYDELQRPQDARGALSEFLQATPLIQDAQTVAARREAEKLLKKYGG